MVEQIKTLFSSSPLFSISLSIFSYALGVYLNKITKKSYVNPLALAIILVISFLSIFKIPYSEYMIGGRVINMFLPPITALLAVSIFKERKRVKENFIPIFMGTLVGSASSLISIYLMAKLFKLNNELSASLLPKSVTTPIALALSSSLGGIEGITVTAVMITGLLGNILSPLLVKILKFKNPTTKGVAIGTSSHALGTSKALEIGEETGAISGIALSFSGLITVLVALFIHF